MGVDTIIRFSDMTRFRNVAIVMGILAGNKPTQTDLNGEGYYTECNGVKTRSCGDSLPECAKIIFSHREENHFVLYHFEAEDGGRLLLPPSTPFWLAMGERLIQFFGGVMILNDCRDYDDPDNQIKRKGYRYRHADDGEPYFKLQKAMYDLAPITKDDILRWVKVAAYPELLV